MYNINGGTFFVNSDWPNVGREYAEGYAHDRPERHRWISAAREGQVRDEKTRQDKIITMSQESLVVVVDSPVVVVVLCWCCCPESTLIIDFLDDY